MQRRLAGRAATIGAGIPSGRGNRNAMVIETSRKGMEREARGEAKVPKMFAEFFFLIPWCHLGAKALRCDDSAIRSWKED